MENECIHDKFPLKASKDSKVLLTGNYNNSFNMIDMGDGTNTQYELNGKKKTIAKAANSVKFVSSKIGYIKKTIAMDFHPTEHCLAVSCLNRFGIYSL